LARKGTVTAFKHQPDTLEADIRGAFDRLQWRDYIKSDTKVFVKPNFTLPFFKPGVTTHGSVIEATLAVLKDRASEVLIGEADGGYGSYTAEYALTNHGIPDICARTGATMVNISQMERSRVTERINGKQITVTIGKNLLNVDESISLPVLKVHAVTKVSLSIKNLWGCHPDTLRLLDHKNLEEKLTLIAKSIHLRYALVDGIYGLNVHGPMDGAPVKVGVIMLGDNPVATDATACRLMGFDPGRIEHIRIAANEGLGSLNESDIETLEDITVFKQKFRIEPTIVDRLGALTFKSRALSKMVFDSPLTKPIYRFTGRTHRRKIVKPGDEIP
jgi:uncharacterized protein (DUF362 family)